MGKSYCLPYRNKLNKRPFIDSLQWFLRWDYKILSEKEPSLVQFDQVVSDKIEIWLFIDNNNNNIKHIIFHLIFAKTPKIFFYWN
jgi:hypothetical protein